MLIKVLSTWSDNRLIKDLDLTFTKEEGGEQLNKAN